MPLIMLQFCISNQLFYESSVPIIKPSPALLILTIALSPVLSSPLIILSANPFPICFAMRRFKGLAPNFGSYPLSASHSLTWLSMKRVILLSSRRPWSSFIRISTMSRRAEVERRLKTINSCQKFGKRVLSQSTRQSNSHETCSRGRESVVSRAMEQRDLTLTSMRLRNSGESCDNVRDCQDLGWGPSLQFLWTTSMTASLTLGAMSPFSSS